MQTRFLTTSSSTTKYTGMRAPGLPRGSDCSQTRCRNVKSCQHSSFDNGKSSAALVHKQQMGCCFKVRSMLVADSCCEKHLDLQTTIVRMSSNIFDIEDSGK